MTPDPAPAGSGCSRGASSWGGRLCTGMLAVHVHAAHPDAPYAFRRATRDTEAPIIGGVAAGLARHLGLPVLWVRVAFVLATALSGLGVALYAGWWLLLPADTAVRDRHPGRRERHPRRPPAGRPPPARRRRPADRARHARPRRDPAGAGDAGPGRGVLVDRHRRGRCRPAVAAGRRGPARALATTRPDEPGPAGLRQRRLGVVRPGLRRRRPGRHRAVHHRLRRRVPARGTAGPAGRRPRRRRPAVRGRPVGLPAVHRPERGACRAHPDPGARRRRRAPARLGAADPGPDPEELRRRRRRCPGWRAPRSATCGRGCTPARRPTTAAWRARCAARPPRSRTPTASASTSWPWATAPCTRPCARSWPRPARR